MFAELALSLSMHSAFWGSCKLEDQLPEPDVTGYSHSIDTDSLLYEERYYYNICENRDLVVYVSEGEVLTWKILAQTESKTAPDLEQLDLRFDQYIKADFANDSIDFSYRKNSDNEIKNENIKAEDNQVIDAGFHQYIITNWSELIDGNQATFSFANPAFQRNIGMKAAKMTAQECKAFYPEDDSVYCFSIQPTSLLFQLFSDPIKLAYNEQKQLIRFRGVTNILMDKNDNHTARIDYLYPNN